MDWVTAIALSIYGILLFAQFALTRWAEKGIQHSFDRKIESLRAELRTSEERFKSDLRTKEAEISALRDGVLSGRANRQALLDKRRFEAVEKIWAAVIQLGPAKALSAAMSIVKYDAVVKEMPRDPKLRQVIESLLPPTVDYSKNVAMNEQPFVSQLAWAYFIAYIVIIRFGCLRADALRAGLEDVEELLDVERLKEMLKAALPHKSQFIETSQPQAFHDFLDELEERLLVELKNMLEGRDLDQAGLVQAKDIMDASKKLNSEGAEALVAQKRRATRTNGDNLSE